MSPLYPHEAAIRWLDILVYWKANETRMKARVLLACVIAIGVATPAFARKYYVVQNTKTLKCSVLPKKPKGKTVVLVAGGTPYKTRSEARSALRTAAPCK